MSRAVMLGDLSAVLNPTHSGQTTGFLLLCMASSPDVLTRRDGGDDYETAMKYILSSWNFSYCHYIHLLRGS